MIRSLLFLSALLITSCTVLPEQVPVDLYLLPPPTLEPAIAGPRLPALRIDRPVTSQALSGNRLLIMAADNQYKAFPDMRLATPAPLLWRDWLLDAFWRDGRITGLSAASEGLQSELELGGTLRAFHVDNTGNAPQAVIQYDATLISTSGRSIIARRRFESRQTVVAMDASSAISALGVAANQLVKELIQWTVEQGQPRP